MSSYHVAIPNLTRSFSTDDINHINIKEELTLQSLKYSSSSIIILKHHKRQRTKRKRKNKKRQSLFLNINKQFSKLYKYYLIEGFLKQKLHKIHNKIPYDICKLILSFYDESTYWNINNPDINKFKASPNGAVINGPSFNIQNILFISTICPNGWRPSQIGSVQYYIELKYLPSNIQNITIYYELYCKQTKSECKKIRIFKKSNDAQSWGTNNLRLNDCTKYNQLEFCSYIKLLDIQYKQHASVTTLHHDAQIYYSNDYKMEEITCYSWNISHNLLCEFVQCRQGKFFYSPNFGCNNNGWLLEIAPNGWHPTNKGKVMLYLRLLKLPQNLHKIRALCTISNSNSNPFIITEYREFCYQSQGLEWPTNMIAYDSLKLLKSLKLNIKIKIFQIIDKNNNEIPKRLWPKYGIIK